MYMRDSLCQERAKAAVPEAHMTGALPADQRAVRQHQHRPQAAALACAQLPACYQGPRVKQEQWQSCHLAP